MPENTEKKIKMLALDLDGTLFTRQGVITKKSLEAIQKVSKKGIEVVIASGREYESLPWEQLKDVDIRYVVTSNGASVLEAGSRKVLYAEYLDAKKMIPVFKFLLEKQIYMTISIDGAGYNPLQVLPYLDYLGFPEYVKDIARKQKKVMPDLISYLEGEDARVQKACLNFQILGENKFLNYEEAYEYLKKCPDIQLVDGGYNSLEFTKKGISKGSGLKILGEKLGISMEEIMAIGDSENDMEMLKSVGLGIAMGNAPDHIKNIADAVTSDNEHEGVAEAIERYLL